MKKEDEEGQEGVPKVNGVDEETEVSTQKLLFDKTCNSILYW